jgi:glycine cleavage system H protein
MDMHPMHYTEEHSWLKEDGEGSLIVGITDHAQDQLGDVVFVQLPEEGHHFLAGEEVVVMESVKAAGEIRMPVDGRIERVNQNLVEDPSLVNTLAENERWFLKIKPDHAGLPEKLMDAHSYLASVG